MIGGHDKGCCPIYWQLSYRRKFIRSLWASVVGVPLAMLLPLPFEQKWIFCDVVDLTLLYTFIRWQFGRD
jgi:hypothetical protein